MQFAQKVFPQFCNNENGSLSIDDIDVSALAEKYHTPLMVYSARDIENETANFVENFDRVFYSMKAAPIIGICKLIASSGSGCNVAGYGELQVALRAGFNPEKILLHGNNKSVEDIKSCLQAGVLRIVVEDEHECHRIEQIANELGLAKVDVQLRVTPGVEAHTHEAIMTGAIDSKFGTALEGGSARKIADRIIASPVLNLCGFHCHIGSQIFDVEPMARAAEIIAEFFIEMHNDYMSRGIDIEINEINIGGGFGICYEENDDPPEPIQMATAAKAAVNEICKKNNIHHIEVWVEPGRAIVGRAGVTIYEVGSIKEIPKIKKYIAVDGGMSDNIRPAIYKAVHTAWVNSKSGLFVDEPVNIVGKHCEEGDILATGAMLPVNTAVGDLVVMASTGAYSFPMSSNYNMLQRPAVVLVDNGKDKEIVIRETIDDILNRQIV